MFQTFIATISDMVGNIYVLKYRWLHFRLIRITPVHVTSKVDIQTRSPSKNKKKHSSIEKCNIYAAFAFRCWQCFHFLLTKHN